MTESEPNDLSRELDDLGGDITTAIQDLPIAAVVLDPEGVIRWQNGASETARGDLVGTLFSEFVAPGDLSQAQDVFRRILCNGEPAEFTLHVRDPEGGFSPVQVSSAPLRGNGSVVGVFGLGRRAGSSHAAVPGSPTLRNSERLTPRQLEVLQLLGQGMSTRDIAATLHLSPTTVRNHVATILATVGAHTRLQAVLTAKRNGLLEG